MGFLLGLRTRVQSIEYGRRRVPERRGVGAHNFNFFWIMHVVCLLFWLVLLGMHDNLGGVPRVYAYLCHLEHCASSS